MSFRRYWKLLKELSAEKTKNS